MKSLVTLLKSSNEYTNEIARSPVISQAPNQLKVFLASPSRDQINTILPLLNLLVKLVNKGIVLNSEEEIKELAGKIEAKGSELGEAAEINSPEEAEEWGEVRHVASLLCFDIHRMQTKRAGRNVLTLNTLIPYSRRTNQYFNYTSLSDIPLTFSNTNVFTVNNNTITLSNPDAVWNSAAFGPVLTRVCFFISHCLSKLYHLHHLYIYSLSSIGHLQIVCT